MGEEQPPTTDEPDSKGKELALYNPDIAAIGERAEELRYAAELSESDLPSPAEPPVEKTSGDVGDVVELKAMLTEPAPQTERTEQAASHDEKPKDKLRHKIGGFILELLPDELSGLFKQEVATTNDTPAQAPALVQTPESPNDLTGQPDIANGPVSPTTSPDKAIKDEDLLTPQKPERSGKLAGLRETAQRLTDPLAVGVQFLKTKQNELVSNMSGKHFLAAMGLGVTALGITVFLKGDVSDFVSPEAASTATDMPPNMGLGDHPDAGEELRGLGEGTEGQDLTDEDEVQTEENGEDNNEAMPSTIEMDEEYNPDVLNDNGYTQGTPYAKISDILNTQGLDSDTIKELQSTQSGEYNSEYHQLVVDILDHNGMTLEDATHLGAGDSLELPPDEIQSFVDKWQPETETPTAEEPTAYPDIEVERPEELPENDIATETDETLKRPDEQPITGNSRLDNALREVADILPGVEPELYSNLQEYLADNLNKAESLYVGTNIPLQEAGNYLTTHHSLLIPSIDQGYAAFIENMRQLMQNLYDSDELTATT